MVSKSISAFTSLVSLGNVKDMSLMRRDRTDSGDFYSLVEMAICSFAVLAVVVFIARPGVANASESRERWGEFQWLSPWIETGASYRDPKDGRFSQGSASFGGRWTGWTSESPTNSPSGLIQTGIEAQISIGTRSLVSRPERYAPLSNVERSSDPALVDAFAGVSGNWGRFRFGLIPLAFGLEDGNESERSWLRPLILRRGLIGLRDVGLSYTVSAGGFYSDWYVHNGEGGEDRDREIWMTARWEYRLRTDRVQWRWGASGQVGRTTPDSTHPAGSTASTISELDPDQSSRLRFGGLHMVSDWVIGEGGRGSPTDRRFGFELEAFGGEILQDARTRRLRALRFDLEYEPFLKWGFLFRGEALDPDTQISGDLVHEAGLGLQYYILPGALKRSLRAILMFTKEWSEAPLGATAGATSASSENHRVEFVLRFSPDVPQ